MFVLMLVLMYCPVHTEVFTTEAYAYVIPAHTRLPHAHVYAHAHAHAHVKV